MLSQEHPVHPFVVVIVVLIHLLLFMGGQPGLLTSISQLEGLLVEQADGPELVSIELVYVQAEVRLARNLSSGLQQLIVWNDIVDKEGAPLLLKSG